MAGTHVQMAQVRPTVNAKRGPQRKIPEYVGHAPSDVRRNSQPTRVARLARANSGRRRFPTLPAGLSMITSTGKIR